MTPAARAAAAIEVLDRWLAGEAVGRALKAWARGARYAGSSDRRAVRDLVFDVLRKRRSAGWLGRGQDGRALVLGLARLDAVEPALWFSGARHAPPPLTAAEGQEPPPLDEAPQAVRLDWPDWLWREAEESLGEACPAALEHLRHRAAVTLRVNLARIGREAARAALAEAGVATRPVPEVASALVVEGELRNLDRLALWREGLVELQDAASQAVVEALPIEAGMRVLDLCAGGGGKTLAMAARAPLQLFCHDAAPRRMADLPARARRAGIAPVMLAGEDGPERHGPFDLVLADVPCSGSGAWARDPEGKWRLTPVRRAALLEAQKAILDRAAALVVSGGALAYATCSLLGAENEGRIADFLDRVPGWSLERECRWLPGWPGDGFYLAVLRRN